MPEQGNFCPACGAPRPKIEPVPVPMDPAPEAQTPPQPEAPDVTAAAQEEAPAPAEAEPMEQPASEAAESTAAEPVAEQPAPEAAESTAAQPAPAEPVAEQPAPEAAESTAAEPAPAEPVPEQPAPEAAEPAPAAPPAAYPVPGPAPAPASPAYPAPAQNSTPPQKPAGSKLPLIIGVVLAAVLCLGAVAAFALSRGGKPRDEGPGTSAQTPAPQDAETDETDPTDETGEAPAPTPGTQLYLARRIDNGYVDDAVTAYYYDAQGNLTSEVSEYGTTLHAYDKSGTLVRTTYLDEYGTVLQYYEEYAYDARGNMTADITYDPTGEVTYSQRWVYDDKGNVLSEENGNAYWTQKKSYAYTYDAAGRVAHMEETSYWDGSFDFRDSVDYEYDADGNLLMSTGISETGSSTSTETVRYEYDAKGNNTRMTRVNTYESGESSSYVISYTYDDAGRVVTQTEEYKNSSLGGGWSDTTVNSYDDNGYLVQTTYRSDYGENTTRYEYAPLEAVLDDADSTAGPLPDVDSKLGIVPPGHWIDHDLRPHYITAAETGLIMRTGPGTDYDRLPGEPTIPNGTEISEVGYTDGVMSWFVTEYNGQYAWICSDYVTIIDGGYAKPVIYLYPEQEQQVDVRLDLADGALTCTYPAYDGGWSVIAQPDGTLTDTRDGRTYSYLYWEGVGTTGFDMSRGFVVKGEDTAAFLQDKLAEIGLLPREYNEFIVYWLPLMQDNPYNLISFQAETYTRAAQLDITPQPDSVLRVFMAYRPLEKPVSIEPQTFAPFVRRGFTVVEWGGTCVE